MYPCSLRLSFLFLYHRLSSSLLGLLRLHNDNVLGVKLSIAGGEDHENLAWNSWENVIGKKLKFITKVSQQYNLITAICRKSARITIWSNTMWTNTKYPPSKRDEKQCRQRCLLLFMLACTYVRGPCRENLKDVSSSNGEPRNKQYSPLRYENKI